MSKVHHGFRMASCTRSRACTRALTHALPTCKCSLARSHVSRMHARMHARTHARAHTPEVRTRPRASMLADGLTFFSSSQDLWWKVRWTCCACGDVSNLLRAGAFVLATEAFDDDGSPHTLEH